MRSAMKWTLPLMAAAALLAGYSFTSSYAQDTKAKVSGIVKQADGTVAASLPVNIYKGHILAQLNRGGGGGRGGRGGAGGPPAGQQAGPGAPGAAAPGAGPTSAPTAVQTATTDDKGAYKFEGLEAGQYTIFAGRAGGGGRGRGGAGGPPAGQQAGPGGAGAPGAGGAGGGGRAGGGFGGRGGIEIELKAGESKTDGNIDLVAGRGGRGGAGGAGGPGGPGGAGGAPRGGGTPPGQ